MCVDHIDNEAWGVGRSFYFFLCWYFSQILMQCLPALNSFCILWTSSIVLSLHIPDLPVFPGRDEHNLPAALGISAEEIRRCGWQMPAALLVAWLYWAAHAWANFWVPGKQAGWSLHCPPCSLLSWKLLRKDSGSLLLIAAVAGIFTYVLWYCCSWKEKHLPLLINSDFWISFLINMERTKRCKNYQHCGRWAYVGNVTWSS